MRHSLVTADSNDVLVYRICLTRLNHHSNAVASLRGIELHGIRRARAVSDVSRLC